ncbi:MAG: molecular chaperone TorD family protein [Pirellulales bacterium]|nr:molecular chaperone TorD family protein [Pirellulales bacterium]
MKNSIKPAQRSGQQFDLALNLAREAMYRFLALSLTDPRHRCWSQLSDLRGDGVLSEAATLLRRCRRLSAAQLALGELPAAHLNPAAALARLPRDKDELNAQYEACFGLLASGACPPYETEYVNSKFTFQRSNGLADVAGFYRAFGLSISDSRPERPDHIALELEFMALVLRLERCSAEEDAGLENDRRAICRDAQVRFLADHLSWWAPAFAKLINRQSPNGFYASIGNMLAAFMPIERAVLRVGAPTSPEAIVPLERPEACEGCGLAG